MICCDKCYGSVRGSGYSSLRLGLKKPTTEGRRVGFEDYPTPLTAAKSPF